MKKAAISLLFIWAIHFNLFSQKKFTINESKTYQTMHGFGASDAWSNEYMKLWNDSLKNLAADWLFSRETDAQGNFKGAGLSIWRFNLGAGSTEQGDSSYISDPFRRTESFLNANGTYDWNKQTATLWFSMAAKERGLENLVMFSNSPPVSITRNGKAFAETCSVCNLAPEKYDAFAEYIAKSLIHFEDNNLHFSYISPVNEPEWGWCQSGGQEGNPYKNAETAGLVRALNKKLEENKLTTQIQIPESGLLVFANPGWYKFKPGRQNEINNFFNKKKENFLGNETLVAKQVCAHSYFTEWPLWIMRSVRKRTARTAEKRGLEYWMTEYCILRTTKEIQGGGRDLGMHTALYIARVIHHDLVYGNASTWSMWLGVSTADYKDGLVYANKEGTEIVDSKLLWVMGNYSHFIQPGAKRIQIKGKRDKNFFISAFKNEKSNEIVLVVINKMNSLQNINFSDLPEGMLSAYETSAKNNLKNIGEFRSNETIGVAPESVTTFVLKKK